MPSQIVLPEFVKYLQGAKEINEQKMNKNQEENDFSEVTFPPSEKREKPHHEGNGKGYIVGKMRDINFELDNKFPQTLFRKYGPGKANRNNPFFQLN